MKLIVFLFQFPLILALVQGQQLTNEEIAGLLTTIENPDQKDKERTQRRFRYLVSQFDGHCPDATAEHSADMLVFTRNKLQEIGLDEGLLELGNTLHSITANVRAMADANRSQPPKCSDTWAMYLVLRKSGDSSEDAKKGLLATIMALYKIGSIGKRK